MRRHKTQFRLSSIAISLLMTLSLATASLGVPSLSSSVVDVLQPVKHQELPGTEAKYGNKSAGRNERQPSTSVIGDTGKDSDEDDNNAELLALWALPHPYHAAIIRHVSADYTVQAYSARYRAPPSRAPPV